MSGGSIKSLSEIFNETLFRIPDFQRGYSWGVAQLKDFWQDLENLDEKSIHYTGVLTLDPITEGDELWELTKDQNPKLLESGYSLFSVIDGQQRLTTSLILIAVILNHADSDCEILDESVGYWQKKFLYRKYKNREPCYIFGYDKDDASFELLKTEIYGQHSSTAANVNIDTLYAANLLKAQKFFKKKVKQKTNAELEIVLKKLVRNFKFNKFEVDPQLNVHVTFETMNNRGKPLSNLELLKNRLIYLSSKLKISDSDKVELRKEIHNSWRTIYYHLGANKNSPLGDDEFLAVHRNTYFPIDRSNKVPVKEFLLDKTFQASLVYTGDIAVSDIRNYIQSLQLASGYWYDINFPSEDTFRDEALQWIIKINRLGFRNLGSMLLAGVFQLKNHKCSETEFALFTKKIERYNFLLFNVSHLRSNAGRSNCLDYANRLYRDNEGVNLSEATNFLHREIYGTDEDYGWLDLERFQKHISDLFRRRKGYYYWSGLTYFLFEYENHLRDADDTKVDWDKVKGNAEKSIEHIYPQTPKDNCWKDPFSIIKKENREQISHDLGNLVLISKSKNSQIKNYCFEYKKQHVKDGSERGFFKGSHSEIEVNGYDNWTPKEIEKRGKKMLQFLVEHWEIEQEFIDDLPDKDLSSLLFPKILN